MTITNHQVGAVISTYLKNKRETVTNVPQPLGDHEANDEVSVSDAGKRILIERMGKRIAEKAQTDISSI